MPLKNVNAGDRKLLLIGGSILLALIVVAFILAPGSDEERETPTTYSAGSRGARAAYLFLSETGYNVQRWERSPLDLSSPKGTTLILAEPSSFPTNEERTKLQEFVTKGGRLIATGPFAAMMIPRNDSTPEPLATFGADAWARYKPVVPSQYARVAPEISLAPQASWKLDSSAVPLYGDDKKAVVVSYAFGEGEIIWWADSTPLTNAGIRATNNLEFFLACIGDKQNTRVLWDEYYHGYRASLAATVAHTQLKWLFVQLVLIAGFALLTWSRRSGPVRALAGESRLSPLEFVETLGGLYERANAGAVAVDVYYQRFRYWATRRLGMAANAPVEDLDRAIRERWHLDDPSLATTLRRCESARYEHDLNAKEALRLVQALHGFATKLKLFPVPKEEKH